MKCKRIVLRVIVPVLIICVAFTAAGVLGARSLTDIESNLFEKGTKLVEKGKLADAVDVFKRLNQRKPHFLGPYFFLANIYSQMGDYRGVIEICKKALKRFSLQVRKIARPSLKNPIYSQLYYRLGTAYLNLGRYDEAVDAFRLILKSHNYKVPNYSWLKFYSNVPSKAEEFYIPVHFNLGSAYLSLGDKEAALGQYKKLQALDKGKSEELYKLINQVENKKNYRGGN